MATIRKRGNLQWEVRVRRKGSKTVCKTFTTKNDAEIWAREIEGEIDRIGVHISRKEAETTTLFEALDRYIDEYLPKLAQFKREKNRALALQKRPIASRFLASLRGKDIADFIKEREREGVRANTIRLDLALLSGLFAFAATDWGMESLANPVGNAKKPKVPGGRARRLEQGEEDRLLAAASPPPFRNVILWAIETAMRREEIASLTWGCINTKRRSALLPRTKNGEARTVPLSPVALAILASLPEPHTGSVFGMSANGITQAMERARGAADPPIVGLTFHDLRHEATSRLFENTDLDVMEIQSVTGHKSLQMLMKYTHLRAHKIADRLAGKRRGE